MWGGKKFHIFGAEIRKARVCNVFWGTVLWMFASDCWYHKSSVHTHGFSLVIPFFQSYSRLGWSPKVNFKELLWQYVLLTGCLFCYSANIVKALCMCYVSVWIVFGSNEDGIQDVVVLSDRAEHLPLIEIRIKECQGNTTTHSLFLLVTVYFVCHDCK